MHGPAGGAYSTPPDTRAGFGRGEWVGGLERAREGKGKEGENGGLKLGQFASLTLVGIDAPDYNYKL